MSHGTLPKPRLAIGATVRIDDRDAEGHCRAPWYLRGQTGTIVEHLGIFKDPELLAYHKPGYPLQPLYKVRFSQKTLWGDYSGPAGDDLEADISENWLVLVDDGKKVRGR
jgi:nitrile hydratase subunit beta